MHATADIVKLSYGRGGHDNQREGQLLQRSVRADGARSTFKRARR